MAGAIFNTVPPLAAGAGIKFDGETISTAAAPRNLLDNSNFLKPVNQRGNSKYVGGVYGIDRWRAFDSVAVANVSSDGINVSGGNLYQYVDFGTADKTKTYTMACKLSNGETEVISGVPFSGVFGQKIGFAYSTDVGTVYVELKPGNTFAWAALYEGGYTADTLPKYQPKGYGAEMVECMRYFTVIPNNMFLLAQPENLLFCPISSIQMRAKPAVSLLVQGMKLYGTGGGLSLTNMQIFDTERTTSGILVFIKCGNNVVSGVFRADGMIERFISLSADL